MRILQIGQLPIEMGGNYTTGVARVVGELSKQSFGEENDMYLYATNLPCKNTSRLSVYPTKYMGYKKRPFHILMHILFHPLLVMKEASVYKKTDKTTFLHMEFIRDNFDRVIKLVEPDLIHFHGSALAALHFANYRHIPVIYSPHGMENYENVEGSLTVLKKRNSLMLFQFADYYTALNNSVVKRMLNLGIDINKIAIVPNGVDSDHFHFSKEARQQLRIKFNVDESTLVFITVGLVIDRKGQFPFLRILESLGINYQYWIIGKGPDIPAIEDYIEKKSIQGKVKLLGYIEDKEIYKYHSAADIYVHGSTTEAQALSEIEAYACGLRIIVNRLVADTVIGNPYKDLIRYFILDFNDISQVKLQNWLFSKERRFEGEDNIDWAQIAMMYASIYRKLLS